MAVDLARGVDWAVAVWAILKAGAAVVPAGSIAPNTEPVAKLGITVGEPSSADWVSLDDPAIKTELSTRSARPVTYADRTRALRGNDPAFAAAGSTRTYDELAAAEAKVRVDAELTFEARTFGHTAADSFAALVEPVAAGVAGASMVLVPAAPDGLSAGLAEEWVTHLFGDRAGIESLDTAELGDLQALIAGDVAPDNAGSVDVVLVLGDPRAPVA
ncbi:MAG: hypothetical protein H5T78_23605 [Nocardia sp.]|nr:hypothetical protein [Nocardia sp.]